MLSYSSKYINYFFITMVILEDTQFDRIEGNCLATSYLNCNFINLIKGGVLLFFPLIFL